MVESLTVEDAVSPMKEPSPSFRSGNTYVPPPSPQPSKFNSSNGNPKKNKQKYKGRPSIIDEPQLVELCEHYIITKNVTALSLIARQRGLPPHLRHKVWPLLLKNHPFVVKPYILPDDIDDDLDEAEIRHRIKTDLKKYFKRNRNHIDVNQKSQSHASENNGPASAESSELLKLEDEIIKVMQYSILRFLKKWGFIISYHSGLAWIALGLAEWVPPLTPSEESANYVLCGRESVNRNGDSYLKDVNDELNKYLNYTTYVDDDLFQFNSKNHSPSATSSILQSLNDKKETATDTVSDNSSAISISTFTTTTTATQPPPPQQLPSNANTAQSQQQQQQQTKNLSFAEIYERMVLVILHAPEQNSDTSSSHGSEDGSDGEESPKEKILTTLPVKGGTPEDRVSFFLYCLRRLLPELAQFFIDEDILNTSTVKDDWVVWWLKWCGAKVWSKYDRGRLWDMLLGWRNPESFINKPEDLDDLLLDDSVVALLGPDLFWHPLALDSSDVGESKADLNLDEIDDGSAEAMDRRGSIKTLISSLSNTNLCDLAESSNNEIRRKIPYSHVDPHTELVFIALSFIKSKEFALLELDQSEIREFLNKASSTKLYGFQNLFEDEMNQSKNESPVKSPAVEFAGNDSVRDLVENNLQLHEQQQLQLQSSQPVQATEESNRRLNNRAGLRDIENIIAESGELWRKWIWQEVSD